MKDRDTGNSKGYGFCVYQVSEFKHYIHLVSVSTAKSYYVLILKVYGLLKFNISFSRLRLDLELTVKNLLFKLVLDQMYGYECIILGCPFFISKW